MPPLVSVVIPCYDQAHFLGAAVASVLEQTHTPVELIVVNDGSPDTTLLEEVLAPVADRLTYIRQANRGLGGARNRGLEACTGEYVAFLDADDRLLSNALTAGVRAFAAGPDRALVWGARSIIDSLGHHVRLVPHDIERAASYAELLETNVIGPPVGVLFRRAVVAELGGFSSQVRYAEDYDLYLRVARGHAIYHHAERVAEYRLHGANMSGNVRQMHKHVRRILERQRSAIAGDARLGRALRRGLEDASERYQWEPRVDAFREHRYAGRWLRATLAGAGLLVRYPRRFPALLARRVMRSLSPNSG